MQSRAFSIVLTRRRVAKIRHVQVDSNSRVPVRAIRFVSLRLCALGDSEALVFSLLRRSGNSLVTARRLSLAWAHPLDALCSRPAVCHLRTRAFALVLVSLAALLALLE